MKTVKSRRGVWKDSGQRNKSVRGVPRLQVKDKEMKIKKDKLNDNKAGRGRPTCIAGTPERDDE